MKKSIRSMTPKEFMMRVVRRVGPAGQAARHLVWSAVTRPAARAKLNRRCLAMKGDELAIFQILFAKIFTGDEPTIDDGTWEVAFAGARIRLPLRNQKLWLDWDNAVSIVGHDIEVKKTYENILRSRFRPNVFFDVGANYGTHSLLFLAHGIRAVSFEPNPHCQKEFRTFCELNNVSPELIPMAVGERIGEAEFWFPERATWLGSLLPETRDAMETEHKMERIEVKVTTLDDFVAESNITPQLIKIDTEGNEINVIKGADKTLRNARPLVIFEANQLSNRNELSTALDDLDYAIFELPFDFDSARIPLTTQRFIDSDQVNFISLPKEHEALAAF